MAWHLYQWGDKVEVLEPAGLRALVEGHARPDFPALPCLTDLSRPSWRRFSIELCEEAGRRQLCDIAQGRAQREGAWRTGEIPQPPEAPFLTHRIGNGKPLESTMKRRGHPS